MILRSAKNSNWVKSRSNEPHDHMHSLANGVNIVHVLLMFNIFEVMAPPAASKSYYCFFIYWFRTRQCWCLPLFGEAAPNAPVATSLYCVWYFHILVSNSGCFSVGDVMVTTRSTSWFSASLISCTAYSWDAHDTFVPFIWNNKWRWCLSEYFVISTQKMSAQDAKCKCHVQKSDNNHCKTILDTEIEINK